MTNFKVMMCIFGGAFVVVCAVFYGFLFIIDPVGVPIFVPIAPLKL